MKRYECTVISTDKVIVEFDDDREGMKWLKEFANIKNLDEHAKVIAEERTRTGISYIEGYGVPLANGIKPWFIEQKDVNESINVKMESEDTDIFVYVKKLSELE